MLLFRYISSNDALAALLWKHVTVARSLVDDYQSKIGCNNELVTKFGMASNGRKRFVNPLTDDYLGNANFFVYSQSDLTGVVSYQLHDVAWSIRQAVDRTCSDEYMVDSLNFVEQQRNKTHILPSFGSFLTNHFALTSWTGFPMYEIDFGYGRPSAVRIPVKAFDGLAILMPAQNGGIDVTLGLHENAMENIRKNAEFSNVCHFVG